MNTDRKNKAQKSKARAPLFASPWVALYFGLRQEFALARPKGK